MVVINISKKMEEACKKWNEEKERDLKNTAEYTRYNGGWIKEITGIDKSKNNGYSLLGDFVKGGNYENNYKTGLYLDCSKGGSRKNQEFNYHLFKILENGEIELIECLFDAGRNYAVHFWEFIEKELKTEFKDTVMTVENVFKIQESIHNLKYSVNDEEINKRRQVRAVEDIAKIICHSNNEEKSVFADLISEIIQNDSTLNREEVEAFCADFQK